MSTVRWGDLIDNAETTPDSVPAGWYTAVVDYADKQTTKTDKIMYRVKFVVTEGEQKNAPVWTNFVISDDSPTALGIVFDQFAALGLDKDYFSQEPDPDQVADDLEGRRGEIKVGFGKGDYADRNEVKRIRKAKPAGQPDVPAASSDDSTAPDVPF